MLACRASRYERQLELVRALCSTYETAPGDSARILQLMTAMQECGQPPAEIVAELAGPEAAGGLLGGGPLGRQAGGGLPQGGECCVM